ncbi:MAG TPA: hypothetical protein VMF30_08170, partial [Pirellulales bacterium]|nr:hypothetical protein [Pirellulales bacterium]
MPQPLFLDRSTTTGRLLVTNGILFAAVCLFFGGVGIGLAFGEYERLDGPFVAAFFLVPGLTLGWLEYRATISRGTTAAATLGVLLFPVALVLLGVGFVNDFGKTTLIGCWFLLSSLGGFYRCVELARVRQRRLIGEARPGPRGAAGPWDALRPSAWRPAACRWPAAALAVIGVGTVTGLEANAPHRKAEVFVTFTPTRRPVPTAEARGVPT